jgi:hypothetical protein
MNEYHEQVQDALQNKRNERNAMATSRRDESNKMKTNARIRWKQDEMTRGMARRHSKGQGGVDRPRKSRQGLRDRAEEIHDTG